MHKPTIERIRRAVELVLRGIWSGMKDLNLRPLRPERSALPDCANARKCCSAGAPGEARNYIKTNQRRLACYADLTADYQPMPA